MKRTNLAFVSSTLCLALALAALFNVIGCTRSSYTSSYAPAIVFADPATVPLPANTSYAKKRGFDDFNCDGITDMFEIRDDAWIGQDYSLTVFLGGKNSDNILVFSNTETRMDIPIDLKWFSDSTKMDVGDINGDCYADVVFTQYIDRSLRDDVMYEAFALNTQGTGFTHYRDSVEWSGGTLGARILSWAEYHNLGEDESLYDYLKMDWGDMDGNGSDDLVLAWDNWNDLDLVVLYTKIDESGQTVGVSSEGKTSINGFTKSRDIRQFDIEDFDGDGKQDLFIHRTRVGGKSFITTVATNSGNTNFSPHQDYEATDTDMNLLNFEKYDTFDVNFDGCSDFVHLGVYAGVKTMSYNLATCN